MDNQLLSPPCAIPVPSLSGVQRLFLCEVQPGRPLQLRLAHMRRTTLVLAYGSQDVADVARIASAEFTTSLGQAQFAQILRAVRFGRDSELADDTHEDLIESRLIDGVHKDLVMNTAQKRVIRKIARIEVRREHNHQLERDLKLDTVSQHEIVHAPVQRDDPAIQKVARRHQLPAKVVDDEDPVIRLHLKRRGVDAGRLVETRLQHAGNQLAAHHNAGPLAQYPAWIHIRVVHDIELLMDHGVVQTDHLAVYFNG